LALSEQDFEGIRRNRFAPVVIVVTKIFHFSDPNDGEVTSIRNTDDRRRDRRATIGDYVATAFTSAVTLAVSFAIGFYGGQWLDRRLGTQPWLTLIGLGLGVTAGFRTVLRELVPDLFRPSTTKRPRGRRDGGEKR